MRAIEIQRNEKVICVAGAPRAIMLSVDLTGNVEDSVAGLSVHGMSDLGGERNSHIWWFNHLEILDGDELKFKLIETDDVTPPPEEIASDSPEYIDEQQEYEESLKTNPRQPRAMARISAGLRFEVRAKDISVVAALDEQREFLTVGMNWNNFGEERTRISVGSFSQKEALARTGGKDWLRESLNIGEEWAVKVCITRC